MMNALNLTVSFQKKYHFFQLCLVAAFSRILKKFNEIKKIIKNKIRKRLLNANLSNFAVDILSSVGNYCKVKIFEKNDLL